MAVANLKVPNNYNPAMLELCQSVLNGRGMPDEWALSVVVPIFKGKGDAMSCGAYKVLGFISGKGTIDAVFILRKLQEEYLD